MSKPIDLTGQRFGLLTVIERRENDKKGTAMWLCKCDCGNELVVRSYSLRCGNTKSCGCTRAENCRGVNGIPHPRLSKIRSGIKKRCYSQNDKSYRFYGARGIKMCDEWFDPINGHDNFVRWALENGYKPGLTIDRINTYGPYSPDNCRWVSTSIQNINRRPRADSRLGISGINYNKRQHKYVARIGINNKQISLGCFDNLEDAIVARKKAESIYYKPLLEDTNV